MLNLIDGFVSKIDTINNKPNKEKYEFNIFGTTKLSINGQCYILPELIFINNLPIKDIYVTSYGDNKKIKLSIKLFNTGFVTVTILPDSVKFSDGFRELFDYTQFNIHEAKLTLTKILKNFDKSHKGGIYEAF